MAWDDEEDLNLIHLPSGTDDRDNGLRASTVTHEDSRASLAHGFADDDDADVLGVDDEVVVKQKRVLIKLDEEKMTSARGIPYLQSKAGSKLMPRLKKQKGRSELQDLGKILQFYQLWAHGLYPRANFQDFIHMARTTGKKPRMKVFRRQWIADEKGRSHNVGAQFDKDDEESNVPLGTSESIGTSSASISISTSASASASGVARRPSDPDSLFVGANNLDEDDFMDDLDIDESNHPVQNTSQHNSDLSSENSTKIRTAISRSRNPFLMDDEDEDEDLYKMPDSFVPRVNPKSDAPNDDELEELLKSQTLPEPSNTIPDDDEMDELLQLSSHPIELPDAMDEIGQRTNTYKPSDPKNVANPAENLEIDDFEQDAFDAAQDLGF